MIVVRDIAIKAVNGREVVEEVLLMIVGGYSQTIHWKPGQRLVSVERVLRIRGKAVA